MIARLTFLALLLVVTAAEAQDKPKDPPKKKPPPEKKVEDPKKKFLEGVGKSLLKADAAAIGAHFKKKGKIELKLRGIKDGKYREKQARSLLAAWVKKIEPKEVKLAEVGGSVGKFKVKYKVRADGKVLDVKIHVYLEKVGDSWLITGIVES